MDNELLVQVTEKAKKWLSPEYDAETRAAVQAMLDNEDKTDLIESFYKDLEFGTGGLRGIMGAGSNRMNIYTVGEINKHRRTRLDYFASQLVTVDNADAVRAEDIGDGAFARARLTGESGNIDAHSSITSKPAALSRRL